MNKIWPDIVRTPIIGAPKWEIMLDAKHMIWVIRWERKYSRKLLVNQSACGHYVYCQANDSALLYSLKNFVIRNS
jgi:hypothetical protein